MAPDHLHAPVLLEECLEALALRPEGCYLDCTFGRGGHSRAILGRLGPRGRVLAMDRDPEAVAAGVELAAADGRFEIVHGWFGSVNAIATRAGLAGVVDGVLLDLGVSSPQLAAPERGFSFREEGPLDMRMDPTGAETAAQWLARASERDIEHTLREYGEERYARRIARAICAERRREPLRSTTQLARLVARAQPRHERGQHPATRTFQAIRIRVNDELEELRRALDGAVEVLRAGGRLVVVSFHSLEDRVVKRFMREAARDRGEGARLRIVWRLRRPSRAECQRNPRARSAVLRVAERLA